MRVETPASGLGLIQDTIMYLHDNLHRVSITKTFLTHAHSRLRQDRPVNGCRLTENYIGSRQNEPEIDKFRTSAIRSAVPSTYVYCRTDRETLYQNNNNFNSP